MAPNKMAKSARHEVRFLKILAKETVRGIQFRADKDRIFLNLDNGEHAFPKDTFHKLLELRWVTAKKERIVVSRDGIDGLRALLNPDGAALITELRSITGEDGSRRDVLVNIDESPLSRLATRKNKHGQAYITPEQFEAGETLRRDFERGQLQPRISAKLDGAIGNGGNAALDISDFAIDARRRFQQAIQAVGPELSDLVMDVCGFLKGLEQIERERSWPPRSAKLMLRTALSMLARHYGLTANSSARASARITTWMGEDAKPSLGIEEA